MGKQKRIHLDDEVIALTSPKNKGSQKRVKGQIYKVCATTQCCSCGTHMINIGPEALEVGKIKCPCGHNLLNHGYSWTLSKHFALINKKTLERLVSENEFELAAIVRDKLANKVERIEQSVD